MSYLSWTALLFVEFCILGRFLAGSAVIAVSNWSYMISIADKEDMATVNVTKKEVTRDLDHCDIPYYVSEFVEREVGNDYDSLRKLGSLIDKLSENKKQLEEQVSTFPFINILNVPYDWLSSKIRFN